VPTVAGRQRFTQFKPVFAPKTLAAYVPEGNRKTK
jgi:ATP-dependent phosphofructokinase / diphosphate-dependent phosphofructokinase